MAVFYVDDKDVVYPYAYEKCAYCGGPILPYNGSKGVMFCSINHAMEYWKEVECPGDKKFEPKFFIAVETKGGKTKRVESEG